MLANHGKAKRIGTTMTSTNPKTQSLSCNDSSESLISVIVPIYNVSPFLDQALVSIETQTHRELQIICVNDGSTDNSLDIIRHHRTLDPRIEIIDQRNAGYGAAVNAGLDAARGTWIAIVEPDDWIAPDMYAAMLAFARSCPRGSFSEIDIIKTPYWRVTSPDTPTQAITHCLYRGMIKPVRHPFKITAAPELLRYHPSIWSALYRRSFLKANRIRMKEVPGAAWTDNNWAFDTLCRAEAIVYLDTPFYHYREETPEKTESFARNRTAVPFERWHDCQDTLDTLDIADEGIVRAQIHRAFSYIHRIEPYVDIDEEPASSLIRGVFSRIDPRILFDDPSVSRREREHFASACGIACPPFKRFAYARRFVYDAFHYVRNTGAANCAASLLQRLHR